VPRHVVGLAAEAKLRGHEATLLLQIPPPADMKALLDKHGIPYEVRQMRGRFDPSYGLYLYRLILRLRPDITLGIFTPASHYFVFASWLARCPVRLSARHSTLEGFEAPSRWRRILRRWSNILSASLATGIIAISDIIGDEQTEEFGISQSKIHVAPLAIDVKIYPEGKFDDIRNELNISRSATVLLCVSRLSYFKGIQYLIDAIPSIKESYPDVEVLLVGRGPYGEELLDRITKLELQDIVHFIGTRDNVDEILSTSTVAVYPSLAEGYGLFPLEAMAMHRPVVATSVGMVPKIVNHGVTGLLVPTRDSAALSDSIIQLLDDSDKAEEMGDAGFERAMDHFGIDKIVPSEIDLYERLYAEAIK